MPSAHTDASAVHGATASGDDLVPRPALKRAIGPWLLLLFIIGDILGAGIYALAGKVAGEIGHIAWLPFILAFGVAALTALSYLELVTKYPQAGGAAVFAQRAFGARFLTFLIGLMVMAAGLSAAAAGAQAFAANLAALLGLDSSTVGPGIPVLAVCFVAALMLIALRGVSESLRLNVAFTLIELGGLLLIIAIGAWALLHGHGDPSLLTQAQVADGDSLFFALAAATTLTFFAITGFEDTVNMAEEVTDPTRVYPRVLLLGMGITVLVYVLVVATAVMLVDPAALNEGEAPLLQVVAAGAPGFPVGIFAVISMFAVANTALIVLLMASRLLYGMAQESVLPAALATVGHRRQTPWVAILAATGLAVVLISVSDLRALADTSSLLTVSVFTVCNVSVLVLRRDKVEHTHFKTPTLAAVLGAGTCAFLASPLSGREPQQYAVAAALLAFGIVLWLLNRGVMAALPAARRRRRPSTTGSPIVESDEQPTGG